MAMKCPWTKHLPNYPHIFMWTKLWDNVEALKLCDDIQKFTRAGNNLCDGYDE